jgi:hypothetical protein
MAKFRKVELSIRRGSGYGNYIISANYKGVDMEVHTHNGECYDYLDDDGENGIIDDIKRHKEKHQEAKRYAYRRIVEAYKRRYE